MQPSNSKTFIALTALWAIVECGLGGILHALHLPFTGIVLGGFSLLILRLLALNSSVIFKNILLATAVVIAIKAMVNPVVNPAAYIAVLFQGLLSAVVYSVTSSNLIACILLGCIAMLESAAQKLLMVTLFSGKSLWIGIDMLGNSILKLFNYNSTLPWAKSIIILYLLLFAIWGIVLGYWLYLLPKQLALRKAWYKNVQPITSSTNVTNKKGSYKYILLSILAIATIASFIYTTNNKALQVIITIVRTYTVVSIVYLLLIQLSSKYFSTYSKKIKDTTPLFNNVLQTMPTITGYIKPLYTFVNANYSGVIKWKEFVLGMLVVAVYKEELPL